MTGHGFAKRWIICIAGLVLVGFAFPFILGPLVLLTGCRGIGGACGAAALVFGIFLRLPLVIGVGIYLALIVWKRSKAIRLVPQSMSFFIISYLAASPLLFGFGNFWAARFALGSGLGSGRNAALFAFGYLLAALVGPSIISNNDEDNNHARLATFVLGGAASILLLPDAASGLQTLLPFAWRIIMPIEFGIRGMINPFFHLTGRYFLAILLIMFCISIAFWKRSELRSSAT
ncbi:hypothetical protein [uncultured Sphingomonas sp.]|uniref:hypothetical protein n=1 Tax=uncultured Sphingomonas sp. TaxID=158754 RepID=UPI0037482B52